MKDEKSAEVIVLDSNSDQPTDRGSEKIKPDGPSAEIKMSY